MALKIEFSAQVLAVNSPSSPTSYSTSGNIVEFFNIWLGQMYFEIVLETCDLELALIDAIEYEDDYNTLVNWEALYTAEVDDEGCSEPGFEYLSDL